MASTEQRRSLEEFEDDFDPDLDISKGRDKVWLVKLPKWLMEHWSKTDQDNVELARIHIQAYAKEIGVTSTDGTRL
jgi:hypothetical protein